MSGDSLMLIKNTREYGRYAIASLMLASGILGLWLGGYWVWLGLSGFVSIAVIDWFAEPDHSLRAGTAKWFYNAILYVQLPLMITLWVLFALHLRAGDLNAFNLVGALLSVSFLSALAGLPAAHELMHRKHPFEIFYSSLYLTVFGLPLNDLAHVNVHHPHVGTWKDGDTPRRGQTVYRFVFESLIAQTREAIAIERQRLDKLQKPWWWWRSRFLWTALTMALWVGTFIGIAGPLGLIALPVLWTLGFLILGGFNYTQHYGLVREVGTPLLPHHSWNHLKPVSRAVSFEISTHSEHHLDPDKHYERLKPYTEAPQMPSIVWCFLASFVPPLWESLIAKPRLAHWDSHYASPGEQALAREANARAGWEQWLPAPAAA